MAVPLTDCMITANSPGKEIYLHIVNTEFLFMSHWQVQVLFVQSLSLPQFTKVLPLLTSTCINKVFLY